MISNIFFAWAVVFTIWSCLEMAKGGRGDMVGGWLGILSQLGWIPGILIAETYPLLLTSAFFCYMYFNKIVDYSE